MAKERLSEDEVLDRLDVTKEKLRELVDEGQLSAEQQEGGPLYSAQEVEALAAQGIDLEQFDAEAEEDLFDFSEELEGELAEEGEAAPEEEGSDIGTDVVDIDAWEQRHEEEAVEEEEEVVDLEEAEEGDEEGSGVGTDVVDIAAWDREQEEKDQEEGELLEFEEAPEEAEEEGEEEFVLEGEMDTEVVDVSALEGGEEEDLLGDIIEDVGEVPEEETQESTGGMAGEETVDMETSEEPTAEITELDEAAIEEETAEITSLEEESFGGEELEDLLAEEEEFGEEEEAEQYWTGEAAVAPEAEAPVSTWVVVVLVLVFAVQMIAGLFVVENSLNPEHSTGITKSLNFFGSE